MTASNLTRVVLISLAFIDCSSATITQGTAKGSGGASGMDSAAGTAGSAEASEPGGAGSGSGSGGLGQTVASGGIETAAAGALGSSGQGSGGTTPTTTASSVANGGAGAVGTTSAVRPELTCSSYCAAVLSNCQTESVTQYKSSESCTNSCAAFRLGTLGDVSGNTLGCRSHFAVLAAADPATYCAAAGPSGGGRCGTNCDAYCTLVSTLCPSLYEDESTCRAACATMTGVDLTAYRIGASGDNVQCRIYHATFAAEGFPAVHCPHTSPSPTAPCAN